MPYVSFISARRCLAAEAGLVTPLRPSPVDRIAPFLGLGHGQTPQARPPAPKLPQPWVDLIHVAPPTAISGGCVGGPVLERAALEVPQLLRYGRPSSVTKTCAYHVMQGWLRDMHGYHKNEMKNMFRIGCRSL